MRIRYYSHASVQMVSDRGGRLLADPWLHNPIYGNMMWQFPPCQISSEDYVQQDLLYISHTHPDHFCPKTLGRFKKTTPIIIRKYNKGVNLSRDLRHLGFQSIIEVDHRETVTPLPGLTVTLLADRKSFDSALVVSDGRHTVFNQNDCLLQEDDLGWIGDQFKIDLACLFFMGCGQFPGSFDMPWEQKQAEIRKKVERSFERATRTAELIRAPRVLPYASDLTWLRRPDLARLNGALPVEFRQYVEQKGNPFEVFLLTSGETFAFTESPDDYQGYFKDREEMWKAYEALRGLPEHARTIEELEAREQSYIFDAEEFQRLFQDYCEYAQTLRIVREPDEGMRLGLRVLTGPDLIEYVIRYEPEAKDIMRARKPLSGERGLHMILTIPGSLLAAATLGALTFEDLANCRFAIARPGPFTEAEDSFWYFLEGFSWYIDAATRQAQNTAMDQLSV